LRLQDADNPFRAPQVHKGPPALLAHKGPLVRKDRKGRKGPPARPVLPDRQARRAIPVRAPLCAS